MEQEDKREQRRISRVDAFQAFSFCLHRSRFSVIILVVGLALLLSDQGQDLLIAYTEDGKTTRLAAAAAVWALSIWGWCRVLLDIRYHTAPSATRWPIACGYRNTLTYSDWRLPWRCAASARRTSRPTIRYGRRCTCRLPACSGNNPGDSAASPPPACWSRSFCSASLPFWRRCASAASAAH